MTLREEFENEVSKGKSNLEILFETNSQNYINWLEAKIEALSQQGVSDSFYCNDEEHGKFGIFEKCRTQCQDCKNCEQ